MVFHREEFSHLHSQSAFRQRLTWCVMSYPRGSMLFCRADDLVIWCEPEEHATTRHIQNAVGSRQAERMGGRMVRRRQQGEIHHLVHLVDNKGRLPPTVQRAASYPDEATTYRSRQAELSYICINSLNWRPHQPAHAVKSLFVCFIA